MASRRPRLLLLFCALAFLLPSSEIAWLAAASFLWFLALLGPAEIRWRPGLTGWWLWIAWAGVCVLFSEEPWMALRAWGRWVGAGAVLLFAGAWWGPKERRLWAYGLWGAAFAGALYSLIAWRHAAAALRGPPLESWKTAMQVFAEHRVCGIGPGLLRLGLLRYSADVDGAHSLFLQVAAETGFVGLCLFAWAFCQSFPHGFRRLDGATRSAVLAYLALAIYFLFNDMPRSPGLLILWWSCASLADSAGRHGGVRAADSQDPVLLPRSFALAGLSVATAAWGAGTILSRSLRAADALASGGDRIARLELAAALAPREAVIQERLAREYLHASPPRPGEALRRIRIAVEVAPHDSTFRRQEAELLSAVGERR